MKHGLLAVLAATAAEIVLAGLAMEFGKRFAFLFLVVPPCLILAGFAWGAIRPRRYANEPSGPHTGCLVGLLVPAFILFGFGWMVSAFFVAMPHEPIERSAEVYDPAESWDGRWVVEKFVPAGARNFRCEGFSGLSGSVRFSCEVGESNFLAHAAANGVELRRDDDTFNANPDTNGNPAYRGIGQSTLLCIPDGQRPERFWFHGWVYSNYGGWAVLYDIDRGILYGHYSHN